MLVYSTEFVSFTYFYLLHLVYSIVMRSHTAGRKCQLTGWCHRSLLVTVVTCRNFSTAHQGSWMIKRYERDNACIRGFISFPELIDAAHTRWVNSLGWVSHGLTSKDFWRTEWVNYGQVVNTAQWTDRR
jgi:hypothetical protein